MVSNWPSMTWIDLFIHACFGLVGTGYFESVSIQVCVLYDYLLMVKYD